MLGPETFLTELYVLVDDFCNARLPPEAGPGPAAALSRGEAVTLAAFGQWGRFAGERGWWRFADARLRPLFPRLPDRAQLTRRVRRLGGAIAAFGLWLAAGLGALGQPDEALDSTAAPTRTLGRRGRGWLAGLADKGWSGRLGWYRGFHLLLAVDPAGVVTGWGFGPGSADDRGLAEAFLAARAGRAAGLPGAGRAAGGVYAADSGFAGVAREARWLAAAGAQVVAPPQPGAARGAGWSPAWRRWPAGRRQIVETVIARLHGTFRLDRERPHALAGSQARLAAKLALHNAAIALNRRRGRPDLAFADLLGW